MNAQEPQLPQAPEHLHEHEIETHIHNPDADRTALERWIRHKLTGGPAAWGPWLGGIVLGLVLIAFLGSNAGSGKAGESAWSQVLTATSAAQYVEIANGANTGSAAAWAGQMAANQFYNQAINSLLVSRETVEQNLGKAKDAYEKTITRANGVNDTELANLASYGLARTLEMQGKLTEAIEAYNKVAAAAADSALGKKAKASAKALQKPDAKTFYQALAAYKPQPVGANGLPAGLGLPANHPSLDGPTINTPLPALPSPGDMLKDIAPPPAGPGAGATGDALKELAPPPASTKPAEPAKPAAAPAELPKEPFAGDKPK